MPKKTTGLSVHPFPGWRFDVKKTTLTAAMCPPYDVIDAGLAKRLRRGKRNAIHVELPSGTGAAKYKNARRQLDAWRKNGTLVRDENPSFYLIEQTYRWGGRSHVRTGILAALGLDDATARRILKHEKTLPKHKADRTKLIRTVKANTSPIFGIYPDGGRKLGRALQRLKKARPVARGKDSAGVSYRVWRVDDPKATAAIQRGFAAKKLLIADGHHRYEVARAYWQATRERGADRIMAYLVAESDPGLLVHPTHRVVSETARVRKLIERYCVARPAGSLSTLSRLLKTAMSPYAFGLIDRDSFLMTPAGSDRGVPTRFVTDWLAKRILKGLDVHDIGYFHGAEEAARAAAGGKAVALLVKPFSVSDIRKSVERGGLLPQKSTYFYPKIATGIAFRTFA